jgi:REP element-mobilizing transposase RayT
MARGPRIKIPGHAAAYHVVTKTNGQEYRLDNHMKENFITTIKSLSTLYYTRYISWSVMDNHTHLLLCLHDPEDIDSKQAIQRWNRYHAKEYRLNANIEAYRDYVVKELTDISSYMKRLNFTVL